MDVFQESLVYADHAGRTDVTLDDVRLAIQAKVNYSFTAPPPREVPSERPGTTRPHSAPAPAPDRPGSQPRRGPRDRGLP